MLARRYAPRKPRYFNRIHTGYEWNKYNQTHYDTENPPPKVVQGYKFNIFYPDLLDKTIAPTYRWGSGEGLCVLWDSYPFQLCPQAVLEERHFTGGWGKLAVVWTMAVFASGLGLAVTV